MLNIEIEYISVNEFSLVLKQFNSTLEYELPD